MFADLIAHVSIADGIALAIFLVGWFGYGVSIAMGAPTIRSDKRMADVALTSKLMQSVSFYSTTTTYVIAGVIGRCAFVRIETALRS